MSTPHRPQDFSGTARHGIACLVAVLMLFHLSAAAAAEERWLLVFDTSSAMKKRLPTVEAAIKNFYTNSSHLHTGDSLGVWTFGQQLHMGDFPLTVWPPDDAGAVAAKLSKFVRQQAYTGTTSFAPLQPVLNRVIANSERLTVIIFCDGEGEINWTPYTDGINQAFHTNLAERKKNARPFLLLLRTQQGKYTGCTVNFPPGDLDIPPFPPLPEKIKIAPTNLPPATPAPATRPPPVAVPPLIIVGTQVGTNLAELQKEVSAKAKPPVVAATNAAPPVTNPPAVVKPVVEPNPLPPTTSAPPTRLPVQTNIEPPPAAPTPIALPPTNSPSTNLPATTTLPTNPPAALAADGAAPPADGSGKLLFIGGGALGAALVLVIFLVLRARRPSRGSLITDSMNAPKDPPRKD